MAFYTRLALRIPQLVEFSSLLEQQVLCAIKTREQLNDKIRLFEDLSLGVEPRMIPIADMFRTLTPPRRRVAFEMPPPDAGAGLGITSG